MNCRICAECFFVFSLLFLSCGNDSVASGVVTNQPHLVCDAPCYDFGRMCNTSNVEHVFALRNDGAGVLQIASVKTGCGCATVKLDDKTVVVGGTTKLAVCLSLRGRHGAQQKSIYVYSDDPVNSIYQLKLLGEAVGSNNWSKVSIGNGSNSPSPQTKVGG